MGRSLTTREKHTIVEFYKSHHSVKEVLQIISDVSYSTIAQVYQALRLLEIKKYEKADLIPEETVINMIGEDYDESHHDTR